jgi:putative resolvase
VALDDGEVTVDLVRDMAGGVDLVVRPAYGRRSPRNRAIKAVGCAQRDVGPAAFVGAHRHDGGHGPTPGTAPDR